MSEENKLVLPKLKTSLNSGRSSLIETRVNNHEGYSEHSKLILEVTDDLIFHIKLLLRRVNIF
jgi:hypothetical protein